MLENQQSRYAIKREYGLAAPVTFLILFILFVYGSLIVGMLGLSRWIIMSHDLSVFLHLGNAGIVLMMGCLLLVWVGIALVAVGVPYFWLRHVGRYRLADKVALIITLAAFHIFSMPFILLHMIARSSPTLRRRRYQKLRRMVRGSKKIEERRMERAASRGGKNL